MDRIVIRGGRPLDGAVVVGGAKNAALPLMAAALLTDQPLRLTNLPRLADIATMRSLLEELGVAVEEDAGPDSSDETGPTAMNFSAAALTSTIASYDLVRRMRASVLVLGPLLARMGEASVSLPGGCAIGTRPVDFHLKGLYQLGAEIELEGGYIRARAPKGLTGGHFVFPSVSVGATENLLMAASLAKGETVLANAAREPEIGDLAGCLNAMGARITGIGSDTLHITGVPALHGATYDVIPDRIESGTLAVAAAITGGSVTLDGTRAELFGAVLDKLAEAGIEITETNRGVRVACSNGGPVGVDVMTEPFPGFPTDMQAQIMALMTTAKGASMITETIFENRFMHVPELARMGANINVHGASAMVRGVARLKGAPVMATDLRASVALILAGLAAEGETVVNRVYHLDRGYQRIERKLASLGADIERVSG